MIRVRTVSPLLVVGDVEQSVAYYRDALGFTVGGTFGTPPVFALLDRGDVTILVRRGRAAVRDPAPGAESATGAWIGVEDVRALHEELVARGARVLSPPTPRSASGHVEMVVEDPDGYQLIFAEGQPTRG